MANKITLIPQRDMSKHLAKDGKVQAKLRNHANEIKLLADVIMSLHRDTGEHHVEVETIKSAKFGHIDWYVSLIGSAAVSVEFGHRTKDGKWVQGIYAITKAGFGTKT
jgi:hypothetical protein